VCTEVHRGKNSDVSSERPEFCEDSEGLRLEDVERRVQSTGESITVGCSVAEILRQEGVERVRR
jgi:hypothetical protein